MVEDWQLEEQQMVDRYLADRKIEIIAIVEGVDSTTGGNVQARHSFTVSEIEWHKSFVNCVEPDEEGLSLNQSEHLPLLVTTNYKKSPIIINHHLSPITNNKFLN